jgi:predicted nuclease of restriction endonuclease-like RecB superfamily
MSAQKTASPIGYFPDFKYKTRDGKVYVVEIKPYDQTKPPKVTKKKKQKTLLEETKTYKINAAKWKAAIEHCAKYGYIFKIVTERELGLG